MNYNNTHRCASSFAFRTDVPTKYEYQQDMLTVLCDCCFCLAKPISDWLFETLYKVFYR